MNTDQTNKRVVKTGLLTAILSAVLMFITASPAHSTASVSHHQHQPDIFHTHDKEGLVQHSTHIKPHCEARGHHLLSPNCPHKASRKIQNKAMLTSDCHQGSKHKGASSGFSASFTGETQRISILDGSPKESSASLIPGFPLYFILIEPPNPPPQIA
ncbi:MAG: hypothetical protein COV66_02760 [Nitrospinae bacterium CG11_big_fil_rev_8_21_14_0_20_45_15]|nr:MAG: hypothetical protein COV66_02760 [Nitrospinae bacterium CG11_big_fil_rev_8_21_14_0_20_45_15]